MIIVANQGVDTYCIFNTVTDEFIGVNLSHREAEDILIKERNYDRECAKERVDRCQPFRDIAKVLE